MTDVAPSWMLIRNSCIYNVSSYHLHILPLLYKNKHLMPPFHDRGRITIVFLNYHEKSTQGKVPE